MSSVVARIKEVKQPRGGYIKPSQFEIICMDDGYSLGEENIHASLIGMVVDYLTRFMSGDDVDDAFIIPILGYNHRLNVVGQQMFFTDRKKGVDIDSLLNQITGIDDASIIAACKACSYDVWYRNPMAATLAKNADEINPDSATVENIRILVKRTFVFWEKYGPVTVSGFTFEESGYTKTVNSGDGDFLTADTLWDFKILKSKPTSKHTLQVLMYYIMGRHSGKDEFKGIRNIGMFNPRLNMVYLLDVSKIPEEVIKKVENDVICY